MNLPILAYHKVNDKLEWGINTVSIRNFNKQIKYLYENNYYSISLEDYLNKNFEFEKKRRPVIITFDDSDESIYKHAYPILKKYGFTATIFVITNFVGKKNHWDSNLGGIYSQHLNWEQIIYLSNQGWEIGSHTENHPDLRRLPNEHVLNELKNSKYSLEKKIEKPVNFLSYPFNRFDERIISLASQCGYKGGCVLSSHRKFPNSLSRFVILRCGVYSIDSVRAFKKKLSNSTFELVKQRVISFFSIGTILYNQVKK